ncbi:7-cyano-7-deazaguanine synthase QueC [bacterium]|nr:7-cyano-7-deazaguanine synthase QueC [bacterium]
MEAKKQKRDKAVVLLSSGLDSTVNLAISAKEFDVVLAMTFDYGQMAAPKEILASRNLCDSLCIHHQVIDIKWFSDFSQSALNRKQSLPLDEQLDIANHDSSVSSARRVWVPNRNGIFLNIAAGYAEGLGARFVIPGFNKEEASTFPDNSQSFIESLNEAFAYSTEGRVKVICFTTEMEKTEIVKVGLEKGVDLSQIWPCYQSLRNWCGSCESCLRFKRAVEANGLDFSELKSKSGDFNEI